VFVLSSSFLLLFHLNCATQYVSYSFCVSYALVYSHFVVMVTGLRRYAQPSISDGFQVSKLSFLRTF
jgi:hypothetical protein